MQRTALAFFCVFLISWYCGLFAGQFFSIKWRVEYIKDLQSRWTEDRNQNTSTEELSFPCNPGNSCCLCDKALDTVCCGREPDCNTDFNWEAQYLTPQCPPATFYSPFIWWEALWCLFVILPTLCCCLSPRLRQHFCRCHHSTRRDPACSISSIDLPPLPTYAEVTQKPPNYDAAVLDSLPSYQEAIDNQQNQSATNCQLVLDINESNNSIERSNLNITANSNG